ncbi:filament-like plant protein 4 [Carica papaya]|uniref:filament-like plant protein 4 n=1 Tax=Carica papaya TaxID=3649 RepID=UPI000B8CA4CF|nr:filament-like plant protein 4 [Carica papaya]
MERLAANDVDGSISISTNPSNSRNLHAEFEVSVSGDLVTEQQPGVDSNEEQDLSNVESSEKEVETGAEYLPLFKLRSRIYKIFESQILDSDIEKIVEDIKCAIQEIQSSSQQSLSSIPEVPHKDIVFSSEQPCIHYSGQTRENQISVSQDREPGTNMNNILTTNLASAISRIHKFVLSLVREAILLQDTSSGSGLSEIDDFSTSVHKFTCSERGLVDFVLKLSHVLYKVTDMNFLVLGFNNGSRDVTGGEYIDKVTLLENKVVQNDSSKKTYSNEYHQDFQSCSDAEVAQDGKIGPGSISNLTSCNFMEKLELLKLEKDNMGMALAICTQKLDNTKLQVQEKEQLLTELKVRLASSQKLYSLAETKLKCMTESYKSLEVCTQELEAEVNLLREKKQKLEIELSEEKHSHQHALARCADLQDKIQRNKTSTKCSSLSEAHSDLKAKQERERADAAEKLAACQETIYLLGKQLQALHPHTDIGRSQYSVKLQMDGNSRDGKPNYKCSSKSQEIHFSNEFDTGEMDSVASTDMQWVSEESVQYCNSTSSPSDFEAIHSFRSPVSSTRPNHTLTKSSSSSSSSALEEEKISHGISRFFSLKGKNEH